MFKKINPNRDFFENFDKNEDFSKILSTIAILLNFGQNRDISKILGSIKILQKIVTKIEIYGYFGSKSRCFEWNWDLSKILTKL